MVARRRSDRHPQALATAIVGGGSGCEAILRMVEEDSLGRFRMRIAGVADIDPDAPGVRYARSIGVEVVTTDISELLAIPDLDLIIELTGSDELRDRLEAERPRHVRLIDHFGARLFWELHQAQEAILTERTEARERVEAERQRIAQIFDSIPDEILVLDTDMMVHHANATFLRNNGLQLDQICGRQCFEVEQPLRGECQVALENCPCATAMRDGKPCSVVRKHFDKDGELHYAAIVAGPIVDADGEVTGIIEMTRDITHRIQLENELNATEVRLQQFMESAPLATYVKNRQGQYMQVNRATCELLGLLRGDILGHTDLEILPSVAADVLRRGDQRVLRDARQYSYDAELALGSSRVFLATTKYPVLDASGKATAVVGLSKDVTAQRQAEAELTRTREYLQNILDNSPMIIVTTDLAGRVVSFNAKAESALGQSSDQIAGKPVRALMQDPLELDGLLRRVGHEGSVQDQESIMLDRSGLQIPVSVTMSQLRDSRGEMIGTVLMCRDISHRKALMNQIIQSERLAAVGRLAAGVAHEINNPLAVIAEVAGYLQDLCADLPATYPEPLLSELQDGLPKLLAHVARGRSITSRLLSFARKSEASVEVADVNAALEEVLPFLEKEARLANISIHRSHAAGLPRVRIEELQLEEVLINLLTNSIQAMSSQSHGSIWIEPEVRETKVIITIRDDGPGIAAEVRDRIFDPFVSTKPLGQGTGLGLSICYGIVKRYDGEIRVQSEPGQGATFQVILPVHREPPQGEAGTGRST